MRTLLTTFLLVASVLPAKAQTATTTNICARTEAVQNEILRLLSRNGLGSFDCAAVDATVMAGATGRLDLTGYRLTSLKAGDFDGLDSLGELFLHGNQLTTLPAGVFDDLGSLGFLTLSNNQLTTLPEDLFAGLSSLRNLWLNENQLTTLPEELFDGLDSLRHLLLHGN